LGFFVGIIGFPVGDLDVREGEIGLPVGATGEIGLFDGAIGWIVGDINTIGLDVGVKDVDEETVMGLPVGDAKRLIGFVVVVMLIVFVGTSDFVVFIGFRDVSIPLG